MISCISGSVGPPIPNVHPCKKEKLSNSVRQQDLYYVLQSTFLVKMKANFMNIGIWDLVLVELLLDLFFLVVRAFYIGEYVVFC